MRHLVLRTNVTSDRWPTRIEAVSPLLRRIGLENKNLVGMGFSFAEAENMSDESIQSWENVADVEE